MKLRCLSNLSKTTTKGKEYPVIKETEHFYIINGDDGYMIDVAKCFVGKFFEEAKEWNYC